MFKPNNQITELMNTVHRGSVFIHQSHAAQHREEGYQIPILKSLPCVACLEAQVLKGSIKQVSMPRMMRSVSSIGRSGIL